jgi:hypothetical protein
MSWYAPEIADSGYALIAAARAEGSAAGGFVPRPVTVLCAWCDWSATGEHAVEQGRVHRHVQHAYEIAEREHDRRVRDAAAAAAKSARNARPRPPRPPRAPREKPIRVPRVPAGVLDEGGGYYHGGGTAGAEKCRKARGGRVEDACDLCRPVIEARNAQRVRQRAEARAAAR